MTAMLIFPFALIFLPPAVMQPGKMVGRTTAAPAAFRKWRREKLLALDAFMECGSVNFNPALQKRII
jgi:hypothetical protein